MTEPAKSQRFHIMRRLSTEYIKERIKWAKRYIEELKQVLKEREGKP